jgi:hypothetical protein
MSSETVRSIIEENDQSQSLLSDAVKFHIKESYKAMCLVNQPNTGPVLTEQQIDEIQQIFLDEGIGRALAKAVGTVVGAGLGANVGGVIGGLGGSVIGAIALGLGLVSAPGLVTAAGIGFGAGALYGLYVGGVGGYRIIRKAQKSEANMTAAKIIDVTNKRDKLLEKVAAAAENGKEDTSSISKVEQLTKEQQKLGAKLEKDTKISISQELIGGDDGRAYLKIADIAKQGKLTYNESLAP